MTFYKYVENIKQIYEYESVAEQYDYYKWSAVVCSLVQ